MSRLLAIGMFLALTPLATAQASVTPYGTSCGSVSATGSVVPNGNTYRVSFTMSGATPQVSILFMVGGPELNLRIFGTDCFLLLDPVFAQIHQAGQDGTYTFSKALPSTFRGRARVQFAEARIEGNNLIVFTTNGLLLDMTNP